MIKIHMIIYEDNEGVIFRKIYDCYKSEEEALKWFKLKNLNNDYKVLAVRELTLSDIYL